MGKVKVQNPISKVEPSTRRKFIRNSALSAAGLFLAGKLQAFPQIGSGLADNRKRLNSWKIPKGAYVRKWGLAGAGPCSPIGDPECSTGQPTGLQNYAGGMSVPGLGIPLGGVGAGSFHYNLFGTFGPWNMGGSQSSNYWEMRTLSQGAFHIHEKVEGAKHGPTVKTLATRHDNIAPQRNFGGVLPAWNQLSPGDGTYAALYPFGWTTYEVFQSDVSMRFWSPIIAGEDERSSMPVAFFDVELANPTTKVINLSVMFTFPNANPHSKGTTRTGLYSQFDTDSLTGVNGVTLGSDDESNSLDAFKSEWTIAALPTKKQKLSYATSWNGAGDGSDIYKAFSTNGELPNSSIDNSNSAGAVAVKAKLSPGEKTTIRFGLSWDFPQVYYGEKAESRAIWMRRYTAFLGARSTATNDYVPNSYPFKQSYNIGRRELKRHDDSLSKVESWWRPIAENPKYPEWLRKAALNELYQMVFNASFWEAGLVKSTIVPTPGGPRLGSEIPGTHLFFTIDGGSGGAGANEIAVDGHGIYNCMLHLLSLQILTTLTPKAMALGVPQATSAVQKELENELKAAKTEFESIFWNPVTGRYRFCDGMGGISGRTGNIYGNLKLIPPPDSVFLDSFYAQAVASQLGLPDLINMQHARKHWNNTIDAFLAPKDPKGNLTGPPTMLDENLKHYSMFHFQNQDVAKDDSNKLAGVSNDAGAGRPKGGILAESSEVIPGIAYMATAAVVYIGRKTGDKKLIAKALKMSEAVANMIFDDGGLETKGMAFGTPESWFVDQVDVCRYTGYSRSRSVWQIVDALDALPKLR